MVPCSCGHSLARRRTFRLALLLLACVVGGCAWKDRLRWQKGAQAPQPDPFEAAVSQPPTPETLCATATLLAKQGRVAESERLLSRTLAEHPRYAPAYCILAELHMRQQRVDSAIQVLSAGVDATGETPYLLNNLGMGWLAKGDPRRALAMFTRAAARMPGNARYRANMAMALGMMGRYEPSLALFEQVLSPADAHFNLAVLCDARKDAARASREYDEAARLRLSPGPQ